MQSSWNACIFTAAGEPHAIAQINHSFDVSCDSNQLLCFCSRIKFSLRRMICVDPTKVVCLWHWRECKSPARVQKPNARRDILFNSLPLPRPSFISYQRLVRVPFWFFTVACSAPTPISCYLSYSVRLRFLLSKSGLNRHNQQMSPHNQHSLII